MLQQSIDELIKKAGNRYALTIITSQRARMLIADSAGIPDAFNVQKPLTVATDEVLNGTLSVVGGKCNSDEADMGEGDVFTFNESAPFFE